MGKFGRPGSVIENFARDGKLRFRPEGDTGDGVPLRRQSALVYALDDESEVRFTVRDGRAICGQLYVGGLMEDALFPVR